AATHDTHSITKRSRMYRSGLALISFFFKNGWDVEGNPAGHHQDRVESDIDNHFVRVTLLASGGMRTFVRLGKRLHRFRSKFRREKLPAALAIRCACTSVVFSHSSPSLESLERTSARR